MAIKTLDEINALLAKPNHAIVGINRAVGAPQLSVVWYLWDGTSFLFSTTIDRAKYLNIQRDPAISLLVDDPDGKWYVVAYGQAEVREQTVEITRRLFTKYMPDSPQAHSGDVAPNRVVIVLHPEKMLTGS